MRPASLIALVVLSLSAIEAGAQPPDTRAVAARIHEDGEYADGLMVEPDLGSLTSGSGGGGFGDEDRVEPVDEVNTEPREGTGAAPWHVPLPQWLRDLLAVLGEALGRVFSVFGVLAAPIAYLVLGSLIVVALVLVVGLIAALRFPARAAARTHAAAADKARTKDPLLDELTMSAEAFAQQGRFGEAIHALFLRSLRRAVELEGRASESTARELVRESDERVRPPLSLLLEATELVWFGGREAGLADYERALSIEREMGG